MTKKALIYCRVSSKKQVTDGDGLGSQEFRCIQFAATRGLEVEKIFHEEGVTGRGDFTARPTMQKLLKYLDEYPTQNYFIIFDDLKRFARDTLFHFRLKQELTKRGAVPLCPNFNFDNSPEGIFRETIQAAFGQLETTQNRLQAIGRMQSRLKRGYWVFSHLPPGYTYISDPVHSKVLSPVYPEARIIKKALQGYANRQFISQSQVLNYLNKYTLHSNSRVLIKDLKLVKRILSNILYTGYIEYPKWNIPRTKGHHKALISLETYETIQNRIHEDLPKTRHTQIADFPLKQIVRCSYCKNGYTSSTVKGRNRYYSYYACYSKNCRCPLKNIKKKELEDLYYENLKTIQPHESIISLFINELRRIYQPKEASFQAAIQTQKKVIANKEKEANQILQRAYKAATDAIASMYEIRIVELKTEIKTLKYHLNKLKQPSIQHSLSLAEKFFRTTADTWKNADTTTKINIHHMIFPLSVYYDSKLGFRTAAKSLPFDVLHRVKGGKNTLVDIKGIYSNQIISEIMSWVPVLERILA